MNKMKLVESRFLLKEMPKFNVGDTVKVLTKIPEGPDKFRLHPFEGVVISRKGEGIKAAFTVRKLSFGEGIERVFIMQSPSIERIEIIRSGKVRRSKLYYLRGKTSKKDTKIQSADEDKTQSKA